MLRLAEEFDCLDDKEHVEDILIEKRVVVRDEWWELSNWMKHTDGMNFLTRKKEGRGEREFSHVTTLLSMMSQVNRCRRNYRLLRDWSKKRSW